MKNEKEYIFLRFGFGHGQQGFSKDYSFTIKGSAFEHNNFIIEYGTESDTSCSDMGFWSIIPLTEESTLPDGIAPTLMTPTGGYFEPKIFLEMEEIKSCASRKRGEEHKIETRKDEVANCVTSIDTDSMVCEPRYIPDPRRVFGVIRNNTDIAPTCKSTDYKSPNLVIEPQILTPLRTEEGRQLRKQGIEKFSNRALYPREDGVSNTITSVQKDNLLQEPKIVGYTRDCRGNIVNHHLQDHANTIHTCTGSGRSTDQYVAENKERQPKYRIRKLTEREVFRLMDVSEEDIDKIQAARISKTAQYKLAGNSIVVSCLYHIFRKMFVEPECEEQQLSLF